MKIKNYKLVNKINKSKFIKVKLVIKIQICKKYLKILFKNKNNNLKFIRNNNNNKFLLMIISHLKNKIKIIN